MKKTFSLIKIPELGSLELELVNWLKIDKSLQGFFMGLSLKKIRNGRFKMGKY